MVEAVKHVIEFLRRSVIFGSIYRIPIRVEFSWFLVFALLVVLVAVNIPAETPISPIARLIVSAFTIGVFFMTLLAHELAHAFMARRKGIGGQGDSSSSFWRGSNLEKGAGHSGC